MATTPNGSGCSIGVLDQTGQALAADLHARPGGSNAAGGNAYEQVVQLDGSSVRTMIDLLTEIRDSLNELTIVTRGY